MYPMWCSIHRFPYIIEMQSPHQPRKRKEMGLTLLQQQRDLHPPGGRTNQENPVGTWSRPRWCNLAIHFHFGCWVVINQDKQHKGWVQEWNICWRYINMYQERPKVPRRCVEFLKHFARINGLQCNLEKTAVIPIGGNYDIDDKLCPELALNLENKFTLPGFQIDKRLNDLKDIYEKCIKKVHEIGRRWASQLLRPFFYPNLPT